MLELYLCSYSTRLADMSLHGAKFKFLNLQIWCPKNSWEGDVFNDLKILNVKNWSYIVRHRKAWYKLVQKTKTRKRLYCQQKKNNNKNNLKICSGSRKYRCFYKSILCCALDISRLVCGYFSCNTCSTVLMCKTVCQVSFGLFNC